MFENEIGDHRIPEGREKRLAEESESLHHPTLTMCHRIPKHMDAHGQQERQKHAQKPTKWKETEGLTIRLQAFADTHREESHYWAFKDGVKEPKGKKTCQHTCPEDELGGIGVREVGRRRHNGCQVRCHATHDQCREHRPLRPCTFERYDSGRMRESKRHCFCCSVSSLRATTIGIRWTRSDQCLVPTPTDWHSRHRPERTEPCRESQSIVLDLRGSNYAECVREAA